MTWGTCPDCCLCAGLLVVAQGEVLDNILVNLETSKGYVEEVNTGRDQEVVCPAPPWTSI